MSYNNSLLAADICGNGITGNARFYYELMMRNQDQEHQNQQQLLQQQNYQHQLQSSNSTSNEDVNTTAAIDVDNVCEVNPLVKARNSNFAELETRLRSFDDPSWPSDCPVTPLALAKAGFYYYGDFSGYKDAVECFHCGRGLCSWEEGDSAWSEHKRVSPNCLFLQDIKAKIEHGEIPNIETTRINNHRLTNFASQTPSMASSQASSDDEGYSSQLCEEESSPSSDETSPGSSPPSSLSSQSSLFPSNSAWKTARHCSPEEMSSSSSDESNEPMLLCKNCKVEPVEIVFLPCSHLVSCMNCAVQLKNCPMCNSPAELMIKTYLA